MVSFQARQGIKGRTTGHRMLKTLLVIFGLIIVLLLVLLVSPDSVQTVTTEVRSNFP